MREYREFQEDRTTFIKGQILEDDEGTEGGKDISAASVKVYFRMYQGTATLLEDTLLTKVEISGGDYADTAPAKSGFQGYIRPETAHGRVTCRIVTVDETEDETGVTPTGYREFVEAEWEARVKASPQP